MSAACAGTGVAWLRVESRQGTVRRNGIKSVPQGWKSSPMSSQSELTKCVPLGACRKEVRTEVQGFGFIGKHSEFVGVIAW